MSAVRTFANGDRVTLRPDRAEAYGTPRGEVYTVLATRPDAKYRKTWVYVEEWQAPCNVVDSRELRPAPVSRFTPEAQP